MKPPVSLPILPLVLAAWRLRVSGFERQEAFTPSLSIHTFSIHSSACFSGFERQEIELLCEHTKYARLSEGQVTSA